MAKNNRKNSNTSRGIVAAAPVQNVIFDLALCQKLAAQLENKEINQLIIYRSAKTNEMRYLVSEGDSLADYQRVHGYLAHFSKFGTTENLAIRIQKTFEGLRTDIEDSHFAMMTRIENAATPPRLNMNGTVSFSDNDIISERLTNLLAGQGLIEFFLTEESSEIYYRVTEVGKFIKNLHELPY